MTPEGSPSRTALAGLVSAKLVRAALLVLPALCLPACFGITLPTFPTFPTVPGCDGNVERIRTESLPEGVVGQPYSFRLEHNCSGTFILVGTYWQVAGDLPPGIMLGQGIEEGRLFGTPTVTGSFSFVVSLHESVMGSTTSEYVLDSKTFSLVVRPAP